MNREASVVVSADPKPLARQGLVCPRCGCAHLYVAYTRQRAGYIMRVRQCRHCGRRIVTKESM